MMKFHGFGINPRFEGGVVIGERWKSKHRLNCLFLADHFQGVKLELVRVWIKLSG